MCVCVVDGYSECIVIQYSEWPETKQENDTEEKDKSGSRVRCGENDRDGRVMREETVPTADW